jgi:serine-type D-Ala-D-Ala carboxypeptidase/endopeptidase
MNRPRSPRTHLLLLSLALGALNAVSALAQAPPASDDGRPWRVPSSDAIRQLLATRMQHNGIGAVVGVIEPAGRRIISYGSSDAAGGRPLDGDTVFQIGSLTKPFTGLLLAEMVRRREVAFADQVQQYLPRGTRMPPRSQSITLLHLSTHRSGLPSMPTNFRLDADPNPVEAYTVDDLYRFLSTYELPREPGAAFQYSNLGVSLLGHVLARRAGKPYEMLLEQRVLRPLHMDSTAITVSADMASRLAQGHDRYLQPIHTWEMKALQASGSLRSTANDLLNWLGAYLGYVETPLKDAMARQLATRFPEGGPVAIGWAVRKVGGRVVYTHDGAKQGYRCAAVFDTATRTGVVLLTNARTDDEPTAIATHLLTGATLRPAPAAPARKNGVAPSESALDRLAGRYRLSAKEVLTVIRKRDHLLVDRAGDGLGMEFIATGERDFYHNVGSEEIRFQLDDAGRATALWLYEGGAENDRYRVAARE